MGTRTPSLRDPIGAIRNVAQRVANALQPRHGLRMLGEGGTVRILIYPDLYPIAPGASVFVSEEGEVFITSAGLVPVRVDGTLIERDVYPVQVGAHITALGREYRMEELSSLSSRLRGVLRGALFAGALGATALLGAWLAYRPEPLPSPPAPAPWVISIPPLLERLPEPLRLLEPPETEPVEDEDRLSQARQSLHERSAVARILPVGSGNALRDAVAAEEAAWAGDLGKAALLFDACAQKARPEALRRHCRGFALRASAGTPRAEREMREEGRSALNLARRLATSGLPGLPEHAPRVLQRGDALAERARDEAGRSRIQAELSARVGAVGFNR